ncbi:MAG TPA: ATP-grasp domain-containing protein [Roseiflexaceae bacterium]|nr:ATP-grasp domain-containing protein [Roseiflexaceae bacterium]
MPHIAPADLELLLLEDTVWIATAPTGVASYDLPFSTFFACRHPWQRPTEVAAIGRFGVADNYSELYRLLAADGVALIHTPEQHDLAAELPRWYPLLADLTPRSLWFDEPPPAAVIERHFAWPVFLKGSRQTSRHRAAFSIVTSAEQYERVAAEYRATPRMRRQALVCRELAALRPIPAPPGDTIPPAFEFRSFWWRGVCVGAGPYWATSAHYTWTPRERQEALVLAGEAARRLALPFLVVDVAQTEDGRWIVIEVNDAQESGYAGIAPVALWQEIVRLEA